MKTQKVGFIQVNKIALFSAFVAEIKSLLLSFVVGEWALAERFDVSSCLITLIFWLKRDPFSQNQ